MFLSLIVTLIVFLLNRKLLRIYMTLTLCVALLLISFLSSQNFLDRKLVKIESLGTETDVVAVIKECTYSAPYMVVYTADIKSISGVKTSFKATVTSNPPIYLENGDTICADMSFTPFSITEYGFDERSSNISNGILTSASIETVKYTKENSGVSLGLFFNRIRNRIERTVSEHFYESSSIVNALLIGKSEDISAETKSNFSMLGISHILSISGTHFTILLGMIAVLLSSLGLNKRIVYIILIPIAFFYIGLSGFSYSVSRAGIMAVLSYWGFLCGRPKDSYTALFISIFFILIVTPYAVFSISLWLSFTATFTILIVLDLLSLFMLQKVGIIKAVFRYIILHLLISVSVIFTTLPIVAIYFGYISILAPLANLIIVPLFELFLYIIPFSVLLSNVAFAPYITDKFGKWLLYIIEKAASIENILIAINQPFVITIAICGITLTIILLAIPLKKKLIIAIPSVLSILAIVVGLFIFHDKRYAQTNVTYFNTSVSDALVITDSNSTACIDITSGTSSAMYYTQEIVKEHYSTKISAYIFTHYRSNHVKSFEKLAARMQISKVFLPIVTDEKSTKYMNEIINIAKSFNIETLAFNYGEPIVFGESEITVLMPQHINRSSHEVISVCVSAGGNDMLYLGSSFSESKFDYSDYIFDSEYIIFGQHYPKTKYKFDFSTNATVIFGSEDVFKLSAMPTKATVLNNGDKYNFLLK